MNQLKLVQRSDALYYPETESDLTLLIHLTSGLIAVNQYGLESLVYPLAAIHNIVPILVPLPAPIQYNIVPDHQHATDSEFPIPQTRSPFTDSNSLLPSTLG